MNATTDELLSILKVQFWKESNRACFNKQNCVKLTQVFASKYLMFYLNHVHVSANFERPLHDN